MKKLKGMMSLHDIRLKLDELVEAHNQQQKDNDYLQRKIDRLIKGGE